MPKPSILIVGQGIAGSVLAFSLLERGCRVKIIDNGWKNSASLAAAGLYNPVTGKRMIKTWNADHVFSDLESFYKRLEGMLQSRFLHSRIIYRPFSSIEERNDWLGRSASKGYSSYIKNLYQQSIEPTLLHDELGGVEFNNGGYLDTKAFLNASKIFFKCENMLSLKELSFQEVEFGDGIVIDGAERYDYLIFCTGLDCLSNSPFHWLPFKPVKGEVLFLDVEQRIERIYSKGVFFLRHNEGYCKSGSTYESVDLSLESTEKGRKQIEDKLQKLIKFKYMIRKQEVGIRPASLDRRPFVGMHPELKNVGICNGLGAKGVSLAPYAAKNLVNHLLYGKKIDAEINIRRYNSLYFRNSTV